MNKINQRRAEQRFVANTVEEAYENDFFCSRILKQDFVERILEKNPTLYLKSGEHMDALFEGNKFVLSVGWFPHIPEWDVFYSTGHYIAKSYKSLLEDLERKGYDTNIKI